MGDTKIRVQMVLDAKEFAEGMNAAGTSLDQFGKSTESANESTGKFSTAVNSFVMGAGVALVNKLVEIGQAIVSSFVNSIKQAVEAFVGFEKAMRNVNSIAQESEAGFRKTSQAVLELAVELGKSPTGLADALFDINSAGVSGAKGLDMVKQSALLAEAGLTDTKTAAGGLLTAMQLYGEELGNTAAAADKFSKANEIGRTTIGELSKEFGRVATTAKTAGVSFNETMAAMAALTLAGQETNLAATNLNAAFTEIIKPSNELAQSFQRQTGSTIQAYTAQNGMIGTLKALNEITGGSTEQMGKLGLSQSALSAIAGLAANNFKTFEGAINDVGNASGTLNKQLAQQQATLAKTIEKWNALKEVILVEIGERLAPVLNALIDIAREIGDAVQEWLSKAENVRMFNELVKITVALLKSIFDSLKTLVSAFFEAFTEGEKGADKTKTVILALKDAMSVLALMVKLVIDVMKPIIEIAGDIAKVLADIMQLKFGEAMKAAFEMVVDAITAIPKALRGMLNSIIEVGQKTADADKEISNALKKNAQEVADKKVEAAAKANDAIVKSHADAMDKQTAAQADASDKQIKSVAGFVVQADDKYTTLTDKDRKVKIKTDVNGLEQLEVFDKLQDGKLILEMDWEKLNEFLLATVHKDYMVMINHLAAIRASNQQIVEKIPPAASSF